MAFAKSAVLFEILCLSSYSKLKYSFLSHLLIYDILNRMYRKLLRLFYMKVLEFVPYISSQKILIGIYYTYPSTIRIPARNEENASAITGNHC